MSNALGFLPGHFDDTQQLFDTNQHRQRWRFCFRGIPRESSTGQLVESFTKFRVITKKLDRSENDLELCEV